MMEMQLQLILIACIVNFVLTSIQFQNQMVYQATPGKVNDDGEIDGEIRENFQNLFDSIAKNNTRKSEIYHEILKHEAGKEQQAFDAMRGELQVTRNRNTYKMKNLYKKMNVKESVVAVKRETSDEESATGYLFSTISPRTMAEVLYDSDSEEDTTRRKHKYGTTLNYPMIQDAEEKKDKSPGAIYRGIVERSINLFWGQQEQLLELKVLERRIREKTKANLREFFHIIKDLDDFIRRQLDLLGDKFWNPRIDHPAPVKPDSIRHFENTWNKFEDYLNNNIRKLKGVEIEGDEIQDCIRKARQELPVRFEDIQKMMRTLLLAKRDMQNCTTTEGTTVKEYVLSLKSLRRNDTRRASFQR